MEHKSGNIENHPVPDFLSCVSQHFDSDIKNNLVDHGLEQSEKH